MMPFEMDVPDIVIGVPVASAELCSIILQVFKFDRQLTKEELNLVSFFQQQSLQVYHFSKATEQMAHFSRMQLPNGV